MNLRSCLWQQSKLGRDEIRAPLNENACVGCYTLSGTQSLAPKSWREQLTIIAMQSYIILTAEI